MKLPDICPHCGESLLGDPIPETIHHYGGSTHYRKDTAIYDRELDRTVAYRCMNCFGILWEIEGYEKE